MVVTANSRAAALGMPELPIRNYWFHQRGGGTGAKMLISPQLQNSFYQEVQPPQAASTPARHPHKQPALAGRERGLAAGCTAGLVQSWVLHAGLLCHRISQHPSVKDSFVAKQMMRYHSEWHRGLSLELKGPTSSCVWVLSTRQAQKSPARCYTQVCTEQPSAGIPGEQSLQLSFLFRTTVLFALNGHSQGSTFISEPAWYLTKSFSDGDVTCAFISSKENLLKQSS